MDGLDFLGLEASGDPLRWRLPVTPAIASGIGALFGGAALAAGVETLERSCGRHLIWATAQYHAFARPPSVVEIDVVISAAGHRTTQARAIGHVGGEEIFTVVAALGSRPSRWEGVWAERPDVPPPDACDSRPLRTDQRNSIATRIEMRLARARGPEELPGPPGDGRSALWARIPDLDPGSAVLAIIGDYVPFGISQALGERVGGNSLDNTLRVVQRPTRNGWMLVDIRIHAVRGGFGHGHILLWAEDGSLLGSASQSAIVRPWAEGPGTSSPTTPQPTTPH
ncbi:MAG: thioesterase family protein [Chloroflexi bacterium]|nr:MAG: thioesterase family protein [Chloroflexota bacterium]